MGSLVAAAEELAVTGAIDPVQGMRGDRVYIFQGQLDPIVPWGRSYYYPARLLLLLFPANAGKIHSFYSEFEADVEEKSDLLATHGVVGGLLLLPPAPASCLLLLPPSPAFCSCLLFLPPSPVSCSCFLLLPHTPVSCYITEYQ